ncbi:GNAT family N-acetyltransferase [Piscibacillus halophilus]|uniref:GNAT family N-acetyltransferase n=2 Tax=Piscibacillus halophilus TaxID=571933 RepID=UPI0031B5B018
MVNIRRATLNDALNLSESILQVERESDYMLYGSGERHWTVDMQEKMIQKINSEKRSNLFIAEEEHDLLGYLIIRGGSATKNKHVASIVIGIKECARGKGIGTRLFQKMEEWAIKVQLHRLELTVIVENKAAVNLYKKMGFEIEGVKKDSLKLGERYVDEYYMAKLI